MSQTVKENSFEVDKSGDKSSSDLVEGEEGTSESDGNGGNNTKPTSDSEGGSIQEVDVPKKNYVTLE